MGIRTASGHIHIGWTLGQDITDQDHIEACQMAAKQLDILTGMVARLWDRDTVRKTMYGNWGAYRPKHYGVEYRTLSNQWVDDIERRAIVFETAINAMQRLLEGYRVYDRYSINDMEYGERQ